MKTYTRLQLAEEQLKASINLFIGGMDRFSVITLAGAADVILARLAIKTGRDSFTTDLLNVHIAKGGEVKTREQFGKKINDLLLINHCKHLDADEDGYVDIDDLESTALAAILKALVNYTRVEGYDKVLVLWFRTWAKDNLDPTKYNLNGASS